MPNFLPRAQAALPTTLSERQLFAIQRQELEARVLEIERRTQASNLVTLRTDIKAMMQDMIKYSLTEFGVILKAKPPQSQSQSTSVDKETPQVLQSSEGEQEGPDSWSPELYQLVLKAEEQLDYDSFTLASPSVTRAPLWNFAEENPKVYSQAQTQARTRKIQAQPVASTLVKPLCSQVQTQAPAQAGPQTQAQAQPQVPAQAQLLWLVQAQLPQPQADAPLFRQLPLDSVHDEDRFSMDFPETKASLIAKQARSVN